MAEAEDGWQVGDRAAVAMAMALGDGGGGCRHGVVRKAKMGLRSMSMEPMGLLLCSFVCLFPCLLACLRFCLFASLVVRSLLLFAVFLMYFSAANFY